MAWTEPRTWIIGEVLTKANLDAQIRDNLNYLKTNIALEAASELTIASGMVTKTRAHHIIDTEGDAATDDLVTINGGAEGDVLLIRSANSARVVVLKHNTGNIWSMSAKDITLDNSSDYSILAYSGSKWVMLSSGGTVNTTGAPESNDIAVFTNADTLGGRSYSELRGDLGILPSIDEDTMVSDSAAHVPTQQSVKAYLSANRSYVERLAAGPPLTLGRMYQNTVNERLYICKAGV